MRVALPIFHNRGVVVGGRRDELVDLIDRIGRDARPDLVVLPELAVPGYPVDVDPRHDGELLDILSEPLRGGPTEAALKVVARRHDLLVAVGLSERAGDALYDTLAIVGPQGVLGAYRKVHLTPTETAFWKAGTEAVTVSTSIGSIGLAICYDRMFPALFRRLREKGAEVLVASSAWSTWRGDAVVDGDVWAEHGALFDRSRAAENGLVLISANWSGPKSPAADVEFGGNARVVDGLGRDVVPVETYDWGPVWSVDTAVSRARVDHVNGGDFFSRDSRPFS